MIKKGLLGVLILALLLLIFFGISFLRINAAVCEIEDIGTCKGECCKVIGDTCIAGPCSVILK